MTDQEKSTIHLLRDEVREWFGHVHERLAELTAEQRMTREHFDAEMTAHERLDEQRFRKVDSDIRHLLAANSKLATADEELRAADASARQEALQILADTRGERLKYVLAIIAAVIAGVVGTLITQGL